MIQAKLYALPEMIGSKVRLQAWVHRLRTQKTNYFLVLRDGTAFTQCILAGDCIRTLDALDLTVESTVEMVGTVEKVKEGQTAPGGIEVIADWWKIVGKAPSGEDAFEGRLRAVRPTSTLTTRTLFLTCLRWLSSSYWPLRTLKPPSERICATSSFEAKRPPQ